MGGAMERWDGEGRGEENMWIIGAKKWTECAQKRRYAACINGNLGHSITSNNVLTWELV
jgi:hypothetical protein